MNEEELKATVGEAAYNAMSKEQRTALLGKFTKPKEEPPKKDEPPKGDEPPKKDEPPKGDDGLRDKARRERETEEERKTETKRLENALKFNLGAQEFVKANADLLPNEISEILRVAEKEKYDSAIEKAQAVKAAIVQAFFSIQANVDLLTTSQKASLEDYLKLTKGGKEQKSEFIFENLFEPALETLKKVKKAEELGKSRSGHATGSKVEEGYKARLIAGSKKTYLSEKGA